MNPPLEPKIIQHSKLCWRLPLIALQQLLNENAFWAKQRSHSELRRMLRGSQAVVSLWEAGELAGFGRANSDRIYRAVLWDVVIDQKRRKQGNGRLLLEALLKHPAVIGVDRVYLMTTNQTGFYSQLGFNKIVNQCLMGKFKELDKSG
mgnify:CR=1 FL=1